MKHCLYTHVLTQGRLLKLVSIWGLNEPEMCLLYLRPLFMKSDTGLHFSCLLFLCRVKAHVASSTGKDSWLCPPLRTPPRGFGGGN